MTSTTESTTIWSCRLTKVSRGLATKTSEPSVQSVDERRLSWQHFDQPLLSCAVRFAATAQQQTRRQRPALPIESNACFDTVVRQPLLELDRAPSRPSRQLRITVSFSVSDAVTSTVASASASSILLEEIDVVALIQAAEREGRYGPVLSVVHRADLVGLRYKDLRGTAKQWRRCQLMFANPGDSDVFISLIQADSYIVQLEPQCVSGGTALIDQPEDDRQLTETRCVARADALTGLRSEGSATTPATPSQRLDDTGVNDYDDDDDDSDIGAWIRRACQLLTRNEASLDRALQALASEIEDHQHACF